MKLLLIVLASYLIGSIPFSHIFPGIKGKDVRVAGTKNVGATNVLVVAGPLMGALALIGDIGKGYFSVYLAQRYQLPPFGIALAALAAVAGHDFSIFLRFKGGKGLATTGGALLAMDLIFGLLALLLWILCMIILRYFVPSTILVLAFVPVMMWMASWRPEYILFGFGAFLLAVYAHRCDLQRFFAGKELTIQESMAKHLKK